MSGLLSSQGGGGSTEYVDVTSFPYSATGDGVTDDRAAIQSAFDAAAAAGKSLYFPAGVYKTSKYLDFANARNLRIFGEGTAVIRYPSDDNSIATDGIATSNEIARCGFHLRNCSNVLIHGLTFEGGTSTSLAVNAGSGIYARKCVGITVRNCVGVHGYALFVQDADAGTTGTGDAFAVAAGVVTLTDAAAAFVPGHVGRTITISNAGTSGNNGTFVVASYVSATVITYANAGGANETSSFRWALDDSDRGTLIDACHSRRQRGPMRTGSDSAIRNCLIERPIDTLDTCGLGDSFAISGTTVTLTDKSAKFLPAHAGKYIKITSATSAGNNGTFKITAITSSSVLTYENASGVTERHAGTWWIMNGERVGVGVGASGLTKAASVMTLTSAGTEFLATDVGKTITLATATSTNNVRCLVIESVPTPSTLTFTNSAGVAESFSGVWSINSFDNGTLTDTYGSTHGVYVFAGRSNIRVEGNTFRGIRTTAVKVSGSSLPIRGVQIVGNTFIECNNAFVGGADDAQEHTGMEFRNNLMIDCGSNRWGAASNQIVSVLGSRNTIIFKNTFHYTRSAIFSFNGVGVAGLGPIQVSRYANTAQPVEDVVVDENKITFDTKGCDPFGICAVAIRVNDVGQFAKWQTGGYLTKSGTTMSLLVSAGIFSWMDVGKSITLVNSASGNDGTFVVTGVGAASLTYENAGGTGGTVSAGTWRLPGLAGRRAGSCRITRNHIAISGTDIITTANVSPEIAHNTTSGFGIYSDGDSMPRIAHNRAAAVRTSQATLRLYPGTSWPVVHDNLTANQLNATAGAGWAVGLNGGAIVDYPLLGVAGRARPSQAYQQVVVAYGSLHVDGDTLVVAGTTYTYKASGPTGNQFNSFAGLVALIDAQTGHNCVDYGASFAVPVTTTHLLISQDATSATDGTLVVTASALNPTALVLLRNGTWASCLGRGAGSAGPTADKTVIWSQLNSFHGGAVVWPDEATGQALLQAGGWRPVKNTTDAGSCEVITHNTSSGTEEFRWCIV